MSFTLSRKTSLQIRATKVKDPQYILYITAKKNITKKLEIDKTMSSLEFENNGNSKKYKVETICDNKVYAKELGSGYHLINLYNLIL